MAGSLLRGVAMENEYAKMTVLVTGMYEVTNKASNYSVNFNTEKTAILAYNAVTERALSLKSQAQNSNPLTQADPNYGNW